MEQRCGGLCRLADYGRVILGLKVLWSWPVVPDCARCFGSGLLSGSHRCGLLQYHSLLFLSPVASASATKTSIPDQLRQRRKSDKETLEESLTKKRIGAPSPLGT